MTRTLKIMSSLLMTAVLWPSVALAQAAASPPPVAAPPAAAPAAAPAGAGTGEAVPVMPAPSGPEVKKPTTRGPALGLSPETPQVGGRVTSPAEPPPVVATEPSAEWKFDVTGYFRAPMRMSWGPPTTQTIGDPGTQIRSPPLVPDANYIDWRYTNSFVGPWTELNFKYGNDRVKATVQIASYNITDSGYRRLESNLGINQAYLMMTFRPELAGRDDMRLTLITGGFTNRYGAAGRYDGGKYETYLFGRTHVAGATLNFAWDVHPDWTLVVEGGGGIDLEPVPFYGEPLGAGAGTMGGAPLQQLAAWEPYPGPFAQESTYVLHGHGGFVFNKQLTFGAHYLRIGANDNERSSAYLESTFNAMQRGRDGAGQKPLMQIGGAELKLLGGVLGDGYLGYSYLNVKNGFYLGDAIEVLHSFGGWQLSDNFFNQPGNAAFPVTGAIHTVLFQHSFSWGQLFHYPKAFWGQGPDLITTIFGMFNYVSSAPNPVYDDRKKLKFGGELTYLPLPWMGMGFRADFVRPDMDDSETGFSVFSPRLIFRTDFVTHEQVVIQYSRYFTGTNVRGMFPYNDQPGSGLFQGTDKNAAQIAAIIWF